MSDDGRAAAQADTLAARGVAGTSPLATSLASPFTGVIAPPLPPSQEPVAVRTQDAAAMRPADPVAAPAPPASQDPSAPPVASAAAAAASAPIPSIPKGTFILPPPAIPMPPTPSHGQAPPSHAPQGMKHASTRVLSPQELAELKRAAPPPPRFTPTSVPPVLVGQPPAKGIAPAHLLGAALTLVVVLGIGSFAMARYLVASSTTWLAPTLLAKSDPRVVQVAAALQQEKARKAELALRKTELESRLAEAEKWLELEDSFQTAFTATLRADLNGQRAELRRVEKLVAERDAAPEKQTNPPKTAERAELDAKVNAVRQRIRLLDAALRQGSGAPYEVLALRREFDRSRVEADKGRELKEALGKALAEVDEALKQNEALLATIDASPYRLAVDGDVALGFVPYENAAAAKTGTALLSCGATMLGCSKVGTVGEELQGEVRGTHPVSGQELRGKLVRLKLDDARAVEQATLYAGRAPFSLRRAEAR